MDTSEPRGADEEVRELRLRVAELERAAAEERRQKEQIQDECSLLRRALESIRDGISVLDRDLRIVYVNPSMEIWTQEALRGKVCYEVYHQRTEPCDDCPTLRTFVSGEPDRAIVAVQRPDGTPGWLELFTFPTADPGSEEITGVIEYVRDITERRRAEMQLGEAHQALERRVAERTAELAEANRRLQAEIAQHQHTERALREAKDAAEVANRAKSQFLANMSHELRTPLNAILGYTHLVVDGIDGPIEPAQRSSLERVDRSAQHLLHLVDEILDLSRIEADKMRLLPKPFDLRDCVEEELKERLTGATRQGLTLEWSISDAVPRTVVGDPVRLQQILGNLVANAIKFTSVGGVTVRVEQSPVEAPDVGVRFAVTDSGIGIAADKQAAIFEAFTQVDPSPTRTYPGVGLGLAICARLVHLMGGQITVESAPGRGSTFSFTARFQT